MPSLRLLFVTLLLLLALGLARGQEMLVNGGMEAPFTDGLAHGWVRNCYGNNDATFAREQNDRRDGLAAQRLTCTRFVDGGV